MKGTRGSQIVTPTMWATGSSIILFWKLVRTVSDLAASTVYHGLDEGFFVATGSPNGWMHDDRTIQPYNILLLMNDTLPPEVFKITFQFDSQWPIIPKTVETSVDFRGWKDKSPTSTKANYLLHTEGTRHSDKKGLPVAFLGSGSRFRGMRGESC